MGGGIGSAYAGLGICGQQQTVLLLEAPIDLASLSRVEAEGFRIVTQPESEHLRRELAESDVVVFNWSHHPALTKLFVEFPDVPIRSVLWCHVSGNYFPHIYPEFLGKFDYALFATPFSLSLPQIREMGEEYIDEHFAVVYGLGDLTRFADVPRAQHGKFIVGYVGTLGFCKLRPDFVEYCAAVDIPDVEFAMIGAPSTRNEILKAAAEKGIADRFIFYGHVADVPAMLSKMDVFSYILNPQHFGATENALLEAMAAGLPAVALNQCVEQVIVKHGVTGLLVDSPQTYGEAIRRIYEVKGLAQELGNNARADVLRRFGIDDNRARFIEGCDHVMKQPKRAHVFHGFLGGTPADWFLSGVGTDKSCFIENRAADAGLIFHEPTKGSPVHYHTYFPEDAQLALWAEQITGHAGFEQ